MDGKTALRRIAATALLVCLVDVAPVAAQASPAQPPARDNAAAAEAQRFRAFVESLWPSAQRAGVSRATFDDAFRGVTVDPKIIALTKKQSEFVRPIWDYIAGATGGGRLARGQEIARRWASTLDRVEQTYGVPRSVILGVWGMETNFGSFTGSIYAVRALATLAFARYRGEFFRDQLIVALQMLERDHIDRNAMLGSWAGAMGQTQFMPTSYMAYAVDGDGDGKRDIWTSVPDALASTANYLRQHGWRPGLPWGFEVTLPQGFDFRTIENGFGQWRAIGVRRADGAEMPRSGEARLFLPGGARGPAFLVTANYDAIKEYNSSDAYAMGVAHLGDRIYGGDPIRGTWPSKEPQLDKNQRVDLQRRLARLGFYRGETDGKIGSKTREAVRQFQLARGLLPDGYADPALLARVREAR